MSSTTGNLQPAGKAFTIGLWAAQIVGGVFFCFAGFTKLTTPIPELSAMMPWTGAYSEHFVRFIALVDLAGGLGLLLPSLTRIQPNLTVLAALGCIVLQLLAMGLHASRGEFMVLPLNVFLLGISAFIWWGRGRRLPIDARL